LQEQTTRGMIFCALAWNAECRQAGVENEEVNWLLREQGSSSLQMHDLKSLERSRSQRLQFLGAEKENFKNYSDIRCEYFYLMEAR